VSVPQRRMPEVKVCPHSFQRTGSNTTQYDEWAVAPPEPEARKYLAGYGMHLECLFPSIRSQSRVTIVVRLKYRLVRSCNDNGSRSRLRGRYAVVHQVMKPGNTRNFCGQLVPCTDHECRCHR